MNAQLSWRDAPPTWQVPSHSRSSSLLSRLRVATFACTALACAQGAIAQTDCPAPASTAFFDALRPRNGSVEPGKTYLLSDLLCFSPPPITPPTIGLLYYGGLIGLTPAQIQAGFNLSPGHTYLPGETSPSFVGWRVQNFVNFGICAPKIENPAYDCNDAPVAAVSLTIPSSFTGTRVDVFINHGGQVQVPCDPGPTFCYGGGFTGGRTFSWPVALGPQQSELHKAVEIALRLPVGTSKFARIQRVLATIVDLRERDSLNLELRDAEMLVLNYIGGAVAYALENGQDLSDIPDYARYLAYGNPLSTTVYNALKWVANAAHLGSFLRADPNNPNTPPGGWVSAVVGWHLGSTNAPLESLLDGAAPPPISSTVAPTRLPPTVPANINLYTTPVQPDVYINFDPRVARGYTFDVGIGPKVKKLKLPTSRQWLGKPTLRIGATKLALVPGQEYDLTGIAPEGVATFVIDGITPGSSGSNVPFVVSLQFMAKGYVALTQEPLPAPDVRALGQGKLTAPGSATPASFTVSISGPTAPKGFFQYDDASRVFAASSIEHVTFQGQSIVVRGVGSINGSGQYPFTATIGVGDAASLGLEVVDANGSSSITVAQTALSSGGVSFAPTK